MPDGTSMTPYVHGTEPREQARLGLMNRLINEPSLRELHLRGGERVLDVGCGLGQFSRMLARAVGPRGRVVGFERDEAQLAEARRLAAADGEADLVDLRAGDVHAPPLSESERGTFDLVYCRFVLEHLSDPLDAVRHMVQAARPGGRIAIQDDDHELLRLWPECPELIRVWRAYYESYRSHGRDPIIGRRLAALLHEAGARPSRITWIFYGGCAGQPDFAGFIENMREVLEGARSSFVGPGLSERELSEGLRALGVWSRRPDAAFWYAMNWAEGKRPETGDTRPAGISDD